MIKINNLNKYYHKNKPNQIHVINNTNLEINSPGLVTFLGQSGAGKSTLLHVIGGLDCASGDIIYDNINFNKSSANKVDDYRNKHIGYIFQNYNLLPDLTVYENLKVQLELINVFDKEIVDKKIDECLKVVGLEKYKRRKVTALSGGQQQRVSIARALVKGAEVIIADEPTGNLDSKNSIEILNILKVLSKKVLVVLVTHDVNLAYHYSDRIIKVKDGMIVEDIVNDNTNSLLHTDSNALYLYNYPKEVLVGENNSIEVFGKDNIKLRIIVENDAIYIENNNNLPIRVLNENTDRYIVEKEVELDVIDENTLLDFEYVEPAKRTFKDVVTDILSDIKKSFLGLFNCSKKMKLLHFSFIVIGIVLCFCLSSLSLSTQVSNSVLDNIPKGTVNMNVAGATNDSKYGFTLSNKELVSIVEENPSISGIVQTIEGCYLRFKVISNRSVNVNFPNCFVTTPKSYNRNDIILENNEIIISNYIAEDIIDHTEGFGIKSVEELLNKEFYINITGYYQGNAVIKGIEYSNDYTFLVSDYMYFCEAKNTFMSPTFSLNYIWDKDGTYFANYHKIIIPMGDQFINTGAPDVLISNNIVDFMVRKNLFASTDTLTYWETASSLFDAIGYVKDEGYNVIFRDKEDYDDFINSSLDVPKSYLPYRSFDINLVSGSLPVNDYEVILPATDEVMSEFLIGNTYLINKANLKVTGYFEIDYPNNIAHIYTNYRTAFIFKSSSIFEKLNTGVTQKEYAFYTGEVEKLAGDLTDIGYPSVDYEKKILDDSYLAQIDISKISIIVSICIIVVMVVFIFFVNRSKMLQNIYELGVLRALGAKKGRLYKQYIIDSIILATTTVVLGFSVMYLFAFRANSYFPGIAINFGYYLLSVLAIYLIMVVAATLPVYTLLRKTPIEIINKYDI